MYVYEAWLLRDKGDIYLGEYPSAEIAHEKINAYFELWREADELYLGINCATMVVERWVNKNV